MTLFSSSPTSDGTSSLRDRIIPKGIYIRPFFNPTYTLPPTNRHYRRRHAEICSRRTRVLACPKFLAMPLNSFRFTTFELFAFYDQSLSTSGSLSTGFQVLPLAQARTRRPAPRIKTHSAPGYTSTACCRSVSPASTLRSFRNGRRQFAKQQKRNKKGRRRNQKEKQDRRQKEVSKRYHKRECHEEKSSNH